MYRAPRCGAVDTLQGMEAVQRDLDRLKNCTHVNLMKAKCRILHLAGAIPSTNTGWAVNGLRVALGRKNWVS